MNKESWSCTVLGMNSLVHRVGTLLAVSTLLVLGTSTPVMAKCDGDGICERGENAKNCALDCTAGDPPPAGELTGILSGGTFGFVGGPKPVVLDSMERGATSEEDVELARPGVSTPLLQCEWDSVLTGVDGAGCSATVFDGCKLLVASPDNLFYGDDDWRFTFGTGDGGVRAAFSESIEMGVDSQGTTRDVEISLILIGVPEYSTNPIPPSATGRSVFTLTDYILAGETTHGGRRENCQPGPGSGGSLERFTLGNPSTLTICGVDLLQTSDSCAVNADCCSEVCNTGTSKCDF